MREGAGDAGDRPRLLTTKDVQDLIRVDRSTVYRMAESGRLPAVKVGRQWRFPEDRLYRWLDQHTQHVDGEPPAALDELVGRDLLGVFAGLVGELLGAMILITDMGGRPLAEVGNPCGLFAAAHRYPGVLERCVSGWRDMAGDPDLDPRWCPTPLGFLCARTLVRVGDRLAGMVLAGGIRPVDWPPDTATLSQRAADLGIPADSLAAHLQEIHHLSAADQDRVLRVLPRIGALLSRLADNPRRPGGRPPAKTLESDEAARRSEQ